MRRLTAVFALTALLLVAIAPATAHAEKGGNSAAAKACQKGGWATLATSEAPAIAFVSQDACVSYAAQGGTIVPHVVERTITIEYTPTGDPNFCNLVVTLEGFTPNTQYTVNLYSTFPDGSDPVLEGSPQTTTDANGSSTFSPFSFNRIWAFVAEVDGTTSAVFPGGC